MNETASEGTGYLSRGYAESLSHLGTPSCLVRSRGWVIQRAIAGTSERDAMGCYPLFCCSNWTALAEDLAGLDDGLVSLAVVADPFSGQSEEALRRMFNERVQPFKEHFVVDLALDPAGFVSSHNRRNTRKARLVVEVECIRQPARLLREWVGLYEQLSLRHDLKGIHRFPVESFGEQLAVPGCVALVGRHRGVAIGMLLWYIQGPVAYYHLGAYAPDGYRLGASFALFDTALTYFRDLGISWLSLGAGAGLAASDDGLTRFKRGWSTGTRTAYFCGHVFDPKRYVALGGDPTSPFFPTYRRGAL